MSSPINSHLHELDYPDSVDDSGSRVPFGLKDGRMYEPRQVTIGKACGCVCPGCNRPLVAKHALKNIVVPHFAHLPGDDCRYGRELAIHLAAKQLIEEHGKLLIPELIAKIDVYDAMGETHSPTSCLVQAGINKFKFVRLEEKVSDFRPDLIATDISDSDLLIEIAVTHFIDEDKLNKITRHGLPTIEIDASDVPIQNFAQLAKLLFEDASHTQWTYHPDVETEKAKLLSGLDQILAKAEIEAKEWSEKQQAEEAERRIAYDRELARKNKVAEQKQRNIESFIAMSPEQKLNFSLEYLGIAESQLPPFLNHKVKFANSFGVPYRVWQVSVFGAFIEKRLTRGKGKFKAEAIYDWLTYRFGSGSDDSNKQKKVAIWDYLNNLTQLGILEHTGRQWFDIKQDNIKQLIANKVGQGLPAKSVSAFKAAIQTQAKRISSSPHIPVGLTWASDWPNQEQAILIARKYAKLYDKATDWGRIAYLLPEARSRDPQRVIWHYSRGGMEVDAVIQAFMIEAGFLI